MTFAALVLALAGCGDNTFAPVEPRIAAIQVAAESGAGEAPLVSVGDAVRLVAVDQHGREVPGVDWATSDIRRAGISERGVVVGLGVGDVGISASAGGKSVTRGVRVEKENSGKGNGKVAVVSVTVSPASFTLAPGGTVQLSATATAADGSVLTDRKVTWSTGNTAIATVSSAGVVTGVGSGVVQVAATADGKSGFAEITVVAQQTAPAPVSSVSVSPNTASLPVGDSLALTATLRAADGTILTGRTVTWSTSNSTVATVSPFGVVRGVAAGIVQITATSEGKSGSAEVAVLAGGGTSPGLVSECASPKSSWIWCDDFEKDRLASYFEHNAHGNDFVRAAGVGVEGSSAMRARWDSAGQVDAGWMHVGFGRTPNSYMRPVDSGTRNYREIYWRFYLKNQPGWIGGGGHKISRAKVFAKSDWTEAMQALVWSPKDPYQSYLVLDPVSYTDTAGNLTGTARWLGARRGPTPVFDAAHVGQWHCIEARVRLNDAGQANGVFELWLNGQPEVSRTGLNWVGAYDAYGINTVTLDNYWNDGAPQAQERYFDNFVVSTERIGC